MRLAICSIENYYYNLYYNAYIAAPTDAVATANSTTITADYSSLLLIMVPALQLMIGGMEMMVTVTAMV